MKTQDYSATISVKATPEEAFKKIVKIEDWWKKNFHGNAEELNSTFKVDFGEPSFVDFKVTEAIPGKKLTWSVTDCFLPWFKDQKEWHGTKVIWETAPDNSGTQIKMTHVGLVPEIECYEVCETGWNGHVKQSLAAFINENKGNPQ